MEKSDSAALNKVREVITAMPGLDLTCTVCTEGASPFLAVNPNLSRPDPFLVDAAPLRLNVVLQEDESFTALLFASCSRELVREKQLDKDKLSEQLSPLLQTLAMGSKAAAYCTGFDVEVLNDVFSRIRKTDLPLLLIERYNGRLLFRARACKYVTIIGDEDDEGMEETPEGWSERVPGLHCVECVRVFKDLDSKYTYGRFTNPKSAEEEEEISVGGEELSLTLEPTVKQESATTDGDEGPQRKRGRPKGAKNRSYLYGADYVNPDAAIKPGTSSSQQEDEENTPQNVKAKSEGETDTEAEEDGEAGLGMVDDPDDQDFTVRKSGRKRTLSRKVVQDFGRPRKRGRPPIVTDPISCKDCGKVYTVLKDFREHCLTHTNSFACDFEGCNKRFRIKFDLEVHERKHRGENPFACTECESNFSSRADLKIHMRKHKGSRPFPCELCTKTFAREQQRKIHMVTHTGEKAYLCPECGNSFGSFSTLIDHRKRKHLEMRDHKCDDCAKGFFTRQELEAHTRTHTGDKPFLCTECGKGFSRTHHLKRHIESVHKGFKMKQAFARRRVTVQPAGDGGGTVALGGVFKLEEGIDGETVLVTTEEDPSEAVLVRDIQEYVVEGHPNVKYTTSNRPFPCPLCPKTFARSSALQIHHTSVHANLKTFLCQECGGAFKANSALIDHKKRVHLQLKPYQCKTCSKEFFSKKDVDEHSRTHTGLKPFQCQECGKCFGRQNHLKRHTLNIHKGVLAASAATADDSTIFEVSSMTTAIAADGSQVVFLKTGDGIEEEDETQIVSLEEGEAEVVQMTEPVEVILPE